MIIIKISAAVGMVVCLSLLAEHVSPRFAGIFSGYPLGAAISLFFIALEISPRFAADSAIYTVGGLLGTQFFVFAYFLISSRMRGTCKAIDIPFSTAGGLAAYFLSIAVLRQFSLNIFSAFIVGVLGILLFDRFFRRVANVKITNHVKPSLRLLTARATVAAIVVLSVTSSAKIIGPRWAGLFAAFPMTMLPLIVIIHATYQLEHVHTIIKNVPKGLGAALTYSMVIALTYPGLGLIWGTLAGYFLATIYLIAINWNHRPSRKDPGVNV
nr:hypothetical protein [uncultured Sphaerochaeta sp.]